MKYLMVHTAAEPSLMYAQGDSLKLKSAILMLWIFLLKFCLLLPLLLPCLPFLCLHAECLLSSQRWTYRSASQFYSFMYWSGLVENIRNRTQALASSNPQKPYFLLTSETVSQSSNPHFETLLISAYPWSQSCAISLNCTWNHITQS